MRRCALRKTQLALLAAICCSELAAQNFLRVQDGSGLQAPAKAENARQLLKNRRLPLSFEKNQGQAEQRVKFLSHGENHTLSLTPHEATFALRLRGSAKASLGASAPAAPTPQTPTSQSTGIVWAWGDDGFGELGNGTTVSTSIPSQVSNLSGVVAIADGCCDDEFSLALKSDGTVWAWGGNGFGELGVGTNAPSSTPTAVSSLSGVIAIAAGWDHSLAVKSDGTVWAWGLNASGELGDGSTTNSNIPVQVSNLSGVIAVAAGDSESLALKSDGTVWVWGYNGNGQLGVGTPSAAPVTTPVQISGLSGVVAIAVGNGDSLVLKNDGSVWGWGYNLDGRLGNGTATSANTPVQTSNLSGVMAIAAADGHSLALRGDGTVWAWGSNGSGELGNGTTTSSTTPVQVNGLSSMITIAAGTGYSMAVRNDGALWAWGFNGQGQLGIGTKGITPVTTPAQVNSLSGITGIAAGDIFSLAIQSPADGATTHFSLALPASATAGSAVTLTVTALNASSQVVLGYTGTVHFTSTDSHAILPPDYTFTAADNGTHVFTVTFDSSGIQTITVTDAVSSAISGASSVTVNPEATTTSLSAATNPSVFGQQVSFTALVTPASSSSLTPTGVVTFSDGAAQLGTVPLNSGTAIFNTSALTVGSHSVTAAYAGDSNFAPSASAASTQSVDQAGTATSLSASPNPPTFGQPVMFTATVAAAAPGAGNPTGTVTFQDGATTLGTATLTSAGNTTFSTSSLAPGSHSLAASYSGDADFLGSTSAPINVTVLLTTIHLAVSAPASGIAGSPFSLTVTALNAANQTLTSYTGTVFFSSTDAQAVLPSIYTFTAADQGAHVFTAVTLNTPGSQTISATDAANASIAGSSAPINVGSPPPPVVQITDNEAIKVSDAESFPDVFDAEAVHVADAAFVTPLIAVTAPVAEFSAGGLGFGGQSGTQTITVSDIGQAPLTVASAMVSGSPQFNIAQVSCSNSATSFPTQLPAGGVCTVTINYAASATPANDIAAIVFTDNAALSNLPSTPSGASYTQSVPLSGAGTNIGPPPPPPAVIPVTDNETIHVADSPSLPDVFDAETVIVSDQVTIKIIASATTTSISAPAVTYGTPASVTVSVTPSAGAPSGSVTLSVDGGIASSIALSGGAATFSLGILNAGSHSLSATFAAQGGFLGSSANSTLVVAQASLTLTANSTAKVYGAPLPALTFSASGFVNGDTVASSTTQPTLNTTATASSGVGSYPISINGAVGSNYSITYVPGTLTVTPAGVTIIATSITKVLDSPSPKFAWTASGFVNGDTNSVLTTNPTCTTTASTTSPVGSYPITCSGASAANYTFSYVPGTLQIQYSGSTGHVIQSPINTDGSSVFKQGRTIPATFRVYDANGVSIGTPGVVSSFFLTGIMSGTTTTTVEDVVDTNNPDTAFRWDPTAQQWIFNITTANLTAGSTFIYTITLSDGSTIMFQYGLR